MIRTFPNLKIKDVDGNIVYMDSFLDIQPYYLKIYDKNNANNQEVESDIKGEWGWIMKYSFWCDIIQLSEYTVNEQ